ncbi:ATP-binding protein [Saccharothrix sp. S26]|uniref:ATP-binding protein n=1 Tax=Saccharothrix sp. S26 TaxID=2907215 RepID=UPI001F1D86A9|nr:ATP-binding protein [Saccharothrix sp. S26]MCE6995443.1 ATP-binding protein [Saccharothrix sp. S26]
MFSSDLPVPWMSSSEELWRWVRAGLYREDEDCVEKVALVLAELVANAYEHGRPPYGVKVWRSTAVPVVRIEVEDAGLEDLAVPGLSRWGGTRGSGLVLVGGLARRWGVDVHRAGKTVWAELAGRAASVGSGEVV